MDIKKIAGDIKASLTEDQISNIRVYINEINIWNKKCDLTALKNDEKIFVNLFLDSFTMAPYVGRDSKLIDIGTGAGFPGLALKIIHKDLNLTLIEASSRKCVFLNHIKNILNMTNVNVIWGRAEEFGTKEDMREKFDVACSRAVAKMNLLAELCLPFVKIGGTFIAPKGKIAEEIKESEKAIVIFGGKIEKIEKIKSIYFKEEKNLVIIKKMSKTPSKYPRKSNILQKKPIR